jgi:hypothetical protein
MYESRLGDDLGFHAGVFIVSLGAGIWYLKADALLALAYALSTAWMFYFTHPDPFYKDWLEDCFFAMLGYILSDILCFAIKDGVSIWVAGIKKKFGKRTNPVGTNHPEN